MTGPRRRLLGYAAALTFAVGIVGGVVASMTLFVPIDESASLIEARLGSSLVKALLLGIIVLYVAIPVGVAALRARSDGDRLRHAGIAALAVFGLPLVFLGALYGIGRLGIGFVGLLPLGLLFVLVTVPVLAVLLAYQGSSARGPGEGTAWPIVLSVAVVTIFAVGFVGAAPFGAAFADEYTETRSGYGGPNANFVAEERPADGNGSVLTFTHEGGDPMPAEHLEIRGEGFATVEAADQTKPGPWKGSVSGEQPRRGGQAVVYGDSVDVGVTADCEVQLVYNDGDQSSTIADHDCTES
ncbi:MAG: hypothetical protein ACI8UR_002271 [Natronomonas sp.]|jgi:hypothetical protein|uniref:hypothetical protein n=1 Tax=Natronomonas sp. TaxID=2184060 RepID=UPI003988EBC8